MSAQEKDNSPVDEFSLRQRRWLRVLLLVSLAILLLVVGSEIPEYREPQVRTQLVTAGPDDHIISPGERVGFLRLGLHIESVERQLGRGKARPTQTAVLYRFDQAGLSCAVQRGQVTSILVSSPAFKTLTGLCVGSNSDQVVRELGDDYEYEALERPSATATPEPISRPNSGYTLHYWKQGIHVNMLEDRVDSLLVMSPTRN